MSLKIFCVIFVLNFVTITSGANKQCYHCADIHNCEKESDYTKIDCGEDDHCIEAHITYINGIYQTARGCGQGANPCRIFENMKYATTNCLLCKGNLCNGSEKSSFNSLVAISCLTAILAISKKFF